MPSIARMEARPAAPPSPTDGLNRSSSHRVAGHDHRQAPHGCVGDLNQVALLQFESAVGVAEQEQPPDGAQHRKHVGQTRVGFAGGAGAQLKNAKGQDQHYAQPVAERVSLSARNRSQNPIGPKGELSTSLRSH